MEMQSKNSYETLMLIPIDYGYCLKRYR